MGLEFELEESDFAGYIPDGDHIRGTITNIKQKEAGFIDDTTGQKAKRVEFTLVLGGFDSNGIDQTGTKIWGETPQKFNTHPDNKLRNWSEAALGRLLPPKYRLNTDELLNKDVVVVVQYREYPDKKAPPLPDGTQPMKCRNDVYELKPTPDSAAAMIDQRGNVAQAIDDDEPF
jgi:hypothetical protein